VKSDFRCLPREEGWSCQFEAFAGPCELLIEALPKSQVLDLAKYVQEEIRRIESTYSRYQKGSALSRVNESAGRCSVEVDEEFAALLDFAKQCYDLSDGLFDVTAGCLRRLWTFDGQEQALASASKIGEALIAVGFEKLHWREMGPEARRVCLDEGVEIDFGGLGKEYAVDRATAMLREGGAGHALVNFGGDLALTGPRADGSEWRVGLENAAHPVSSVAHPHVSACNPAANAVTDLIYLSEGAIATSGDSKRFFLHRGERYGHILDPRTAYPVRGAPQSISVAAPTCLMAGMLATIAMLKGPQASSFLEQCGQPFWVQST
jgi:FAD:protein FMN transferase